METIFDIQVLTDGNGLVRIEMHDGTERPIASSQRRFTAEDAEEQVGWIAKTLATATFSAVLSGAL